MRAKIARGVNAVRLICSPPSEYVGVNHDQTDWAGLCTWNTTKVDFGGQAKWVECMILPVLVKTVHTGDC